MFDDRLAHIARLAEAMLESLLVDAAGTGEIARPPRLMAALRHGVLSGGKRVRPFLLVESARLFGVADEVAIRAGAALELVHCYSLVHDDLPAMDDDDLRRGRPTVHRAYDEATAILAGDAALTLAFEVLADPATHADSGARTDLVATLARASGLGGMVGGQILDLAAEGRFDGGTVHRLNESEIKTLQAMKTGALIRAACEMGAILGGAEPEARATLVSYGRLVGLAFQIADDLIDLEGDAATAGKATGKDAGAGKGTLVSLHGAAWARDELTRLVGAAETVLACFGDRAKTLAETARFVAFRNT